ncbi:hypothetical protein K488DRAFT_92802, partial [Vararia minispora EC-137]
TSPTSAIRAKRRIYARAGLPDLEADAQLSQLLAGGTADDAAARVAATYVAPDGSRWADADEPVEFAPLLPRAREDDGWTVLVPSSASFSVPSTAPSALGPIQSPALPLPPSPALAPHNPPLLAIPARARGGGPSAYADARAFIAPFPPKSPRSYVFTAPRRTRRRPAPLQLPLPAPTPRRPTASPSPRAAFLADSFNPARAPTALVPLAPALGSPTVVVPVPVEAEALRPRPAKKASRVNLRGIFKRRD